MQGLIAGLIAGAAGTVALNVSTYLDMTVRGRPASTVPARVAERMADAVGLDPLTGGPAGGDESVQNRQSGAGALLGYATGLGIGLAYGAIAGRLGRPASPPVAGLVLGAAAMAMSDVPAVTTGVTDPREWGAEGWLSDIIPHLAYGLVTAIAFDALRGRSRGLRL